MAFKVITGDEQNITWRNVRFIGDNTIKSDNSIAKSEQNGISLLKIRVRDNSYGEINVKWSVRDDFNKIDHFLIICDFQGIKAPIGVAAKLKNVTNYTFTDQETFTYVGTRTYRIVAVLKTGQFIKFKKNIKYTKVANIPIANTVKSTKKNPNLNHGITNDINTAGDHLIELPIKETKSGFETRFNKEMKDKVLKNHKILRK